MWQRDTFVSLTAAAAMTAVMADNLLTALCLDLLGELVDELNPLSNLLMGHWGVPLTMVANAFWSLIVIVWLLLEAHQSQSRWPLLLLLSLVLIRGVAAVNNFIILRGALS